MAKELGKSDYHRRIKPLNGNTQLFRRKLLLIGAIKVNRLAGSVRQCLDIIDLLVAHVSILWLFTHDVIDQAYLVKAADQQPQILVRQTCGKGFLDCPRGWFPLGP